MRLRSRPSVRALGFPLLVVFVACGGGAPAPSQVAQRNGGAAPDAVANADAGATRTPSDEGHAAPLVTTPLPADAIVRVPDSELHPHLETPAELAKLYDAKTDAVARMKALVDIDGKIRTLRTTPEKDRGPLLVTYLKSRADIEDAGDIPGLNAWGRFRDGRVLTIETHDQQHAATAAATAEPHARGAKTYTEGKNAVILDAMRYDMDGSQRYNTWANNAGYQSQLVTAAAAEPRALFASIKDETALLYVNAHGGSGYERNGVDTFSLTTSQRVYDCEGNKISGWGNGFAPADITRLAQCSDRTITAAMWAAGEVSYTYATNYDRVDDNPSHDAEWGGWHYGITHRYVRNHFTLKANSLVYLNVCQAGAARGAALRSAFLGSGASAVVAFDDDIEPRKGIRISNLFLARLLGVVNEHTDAGSPPQRPWDIDAILGEAHARGFDFTTIEGPTKVVRANVHVFRSGGSEEMLLPSIKYLDVNEANRLLSVFGDFGKDPGDKGKVVVGQDNCPIKHWTETQIDCDLGAASFLFGDVVVSSRDRKSNKAPLTAWKFTANSDFELPPSAPGHFDFAWSFAINMRADVHKHRDTKPTDDGKPRDEFDVYGAPSSRCESQPSGYLHIKGATVKALAVPPVFASSAPTSNGSCVMFGRLDPAAKTLKLGLYAQQPPSSPSYAGNGRTAHGLGAMPFMLWPEMSDGELQMSFQFQLPPGVTLPPEALARMGAQKIPLKSVTLHFDDKWALLDATKTGHPEQATAIFAVHGVPGFNVPDDKTAQ